MEATQIDVNLNTVSHMHGWGAYINYYVMYAPVLALPGRYAH